MVKMGALLKTQVFVLVLIINVPVYKGYVKLSFFPEKPRLNSPLHFQCKHAMGGSIEWFKGYLPIAVCSASKDLCIHKPTDYEFTTWMDGSVSYYNLTVKRCKLSDCAEFRCLDFSVPPKEAKRRIKVTQFDSDFPSSFNEPGSSHKSGNINFTTPCISDPHSVKKNIKFYKIKTNVTSDFEPLRWNVTEGTVPCATCNGKSTTKLTISFDHEEARGNVDEVQFRVTLFHDSNISDKLIVTTEYLYFVESDEPVDNNLLTLAGVFFKTVLPWFIMFSITSCCIKLVHRKGSRPATFKCMRIEEKYNTKRVLMWLFIAIYLILNVIVTCIMRLLQGPHILRKPNAENRTKPSGQSIDKEQSETLLDQEILNAIEKEILRTDTEPAKDLSEICIHHRGSISGSLPDEPILTFKPKEDNLWLGKTAKGQCYRSRSLST